MAKIELLPKQVYNQIAAGEVVEKPASIIKELVENCIDAKAKNITIEIKKGGIDYIAITDDGTGIEAEDIEMAFVPHATSKIRSYEDLNTLVSMGFRGEALASISAVCKLEMITKTSSSETGTKICLNGGEVVSKSEIATVTGTKIIIKDLFYNTPARAKFLRKPKTEEGDITNYVEKLMLSNVGINFRYIVDDEIKYNTTNCSLIETIYTIYGKDVAQNVLEVNYEQGGYSITGYISKPSIAKNNRTYQSLFVNKRFCTNPVVSSAISKAYDSFLMKGKFPLYVLSLTLPPQSVDVNVHPNKLEVKFENTSKIYMMFNDAISSTLYADTHLRFAESEDDDSEEDLSEISTINTVEPISLATMPESEGISYSASNKDENIFTYSENDKKTDEVLEMIKNTPIEEIQVIGTTPLSFSQDVLFDEFNEDSIPKSIKQSLDKQVEKIEQVYEDLFSVERKIIGVAFNTYIIVEESDKLYFIDQHAAHERQLFDKFQKQIEQNDVMKQDLLIPYILNVSEQESYFIYNNLELLQEYGFEISEFGHNCYRVSSIPLLLSEIDLKQYFDEILSNLNSIVKKPIEVIRNNIATMACKAAVKGGNTLSMQEINILLNTL
ncbi:MAG: DNA mismatch repair endonuclease MutL, partial [Clostridia bacterium]|nr:DNA mismatch repair endonuclease MutL [Clostridia bacterium]